MSRKGFLVTVELDIQKITCPGVWLCSNGKVSLQIYMLDSCIQTKSARPVFPINCYEKFIFSKTFYKERRLNELQRSLNNEWLYVELIQWQNCKEGCVLATFQTTLDDLLYPTSIRGSVAGTDLDLLMEPTKLFPGTIAPKLEASTKTTIEETINDLRESTPSTVIVNPKTLTSTSVSKSRRNRSRKVCHSVAYSRARKNIQKRKPRPIFKYKKAEDDLILRTNPNKVLKDESSPSTSPRHTRQTTEDVFIKLQKRCPTHETLGESICPCYCRSKSVGAKHIRPAVAKVRYYEDSEDRSRGNSDTCACERIHQEYYCPICTKYEGYFATEKKPIIHSSSFLPERATCRAKAEPHRHHIRTPGGSPCRSDIEASERNCACTTASRASSLAKQLHERLARSLERNARMIRQYVDC